MSKTVKKLMTGTYRERFGDLTEAALIDIRGIKANDNNELRTELARKQIRVTVIRNTLARSAFKDTGLEPLEELIDGPTALAYGGDDVSVVNVARELMDWARKLDNLELKGAVLDGTVFGADEMARLSKFPTREEAQAQVVQIILTPAQKLAGAIASPGAKLAGIIKTLQEKLEEGEQIKAA